MRDVTDFLLARITEDEAVAREAANHYPEHCRLYVVDDNYRFDQVGATATRVFAECRAKRVAVDWYLNDDYVVMGPTVHALAAVYADHPDYRDEWTP